MAKKIDSWKWNEDRNILSAIIDETKAQVDFNLEKFTDYEQPACPMMLEAAIHGLKVKLTGAINGKSVIAKDMPKLMEALFAQLVETNEWAQRKAATETVAVADVFAKAKEMGLTEEQMELLKSAIGQARAKK